MTTPTLSRDYIFALADALDVACHCDDDELHSDYGVEGDRIISHAVFDFANKIYQSGLDAGAKMKDAEIARLRKALEFYASEENYIDGAEGQDPPIYFDSGQAARATLSTGIAEKS